MLDYLSRGGSIVWLIIICSIFALASFLEKLIKIHSSRINTDRFLAEIEQLVRQDRIQEAIDLCNRINAPVTRVVRAGISNLNATRDRIQNRMEEVALIELPKIEEHLGIMATVAHITPLLGLLGTVTGMIRAFQVIEKKAQELTMTSPGDLAEGIWAALITTALGLSVAIPTLVGYNYLRHYVKILQHDMERAASRVMTFV